MALLCTTFVLLFIHTSCAKELATQNETTGISVTTNAASMTQTEQTASETYTELYSMLVSLTPEGHMPYPVTTAVSVRDQDAFDWMRLYLQKNKASFDLISEEVLNSNDPHWSLLTNHGDGFSPDYLEVTNKNWEALSKFTQQALDTIDADFREKFSQDDDISFSVSAVGIREDGRRGIHFSWTIFGEDEEELSRLLSYFPDGYANIRPDTPYVDFGDGWYFYSGDGV